MKTFVKYIPLAILMLFLAACESRKLNRLFAEVDALIESRPDSALALLEGVSADVLPRPLSQQMRYQLLRAKAMNKAFVNFTSDSTMLEVVDYFDQHGTANERMQAYYLLGCAYRDLNEVPLAIECYKDAVSKADTTSADCDFRCMMSIYGQMATLYDRQMMPEEEIAALEALSKIAVLRDDTISFIKSKELQVRPYNLLRDTARIYSLTQEVFDLYMQCGDTMRAARILPVAIANKINFRQYEEAERMILFYERESRNFDSEGNINPRFSHYYNSKAKYYVGLNRLDSAEFYYRKLLQYGHVTEASRGLMEIYRTHEVWDSVLHYNTMYENSYKEFYTSLRTESVRNASSLYDYTRNQRLAQERKAEAERLQRLLWTIIFISLVLLAAAFYLYRRQKRKKDERIQTLVSDYLQLSARCDKEHHDLELSKQDFTRFVENKEAELKQLSGQLAESRQQLGSVQTVVRMEELHRSRIAEDFKRMAIPGPNQKLPTDKQWEELMMLVKECNYPLYVKIIENNKLSQRELRVTLLVSLNFTVGDIANLLQTTSQSIVNSKGKANKKLFQEKGGQSLGINILGIR